MGQNIKQKGPEKELEKTVRIKGADYDFLSAMGKDLLNRSAEFLVQYFVDDGIKRLKKTVKEEEWSTFIYDLLAHLGAKRELLTAAI